MPKDTSLTLVYFDAKGIAEISRLLFALAQVNYVDKRYPLKKDGDTYIHDEFTKDKNKGLFVKSFGKLPILKSGDHLISQSKAIERYIAKRFRFLGNSPMEEAKIDSICEHIRDIKHRYESMYKNDTSKYYGEVLSEELKNLVNTFDENTTFAIGEKISLADVTIYHLITHYYDSGEIKKIVTGIPRIMNIVMRVASRPEIRVYIEDRKVTPF